MQRSTTARPSAESGRKERPAGRGLSGDRIRKKLLGTRDRNGWIKLAAIYGLLICIGFIYVYPILYMISDAATYMTGATVVLDGGRTIW